MAATDEWRVESYRDMDVYVLTVERSTGGASGSGNAEESSRWGYEVRVCQEGTDPSDAGDSELLNSGDQIYPSRMAAEAAAFDGGYRLIDRLLGVPG